MDSISRSVGKASARQRANILLISGLGEEDTLSLYKKALWSPHEAARDGQLRPLLGKMFKRFRNAILKNHQIYDRFLFLLIKLHESRAEYGVDYLLKSGLDYPHYFTLSRRAIKNPVRSLLDTVMRKRVVHIFEQFRNIILSDERLFSMVKGYLLGRGNLVENSRE